MTTQESTKIGTAVEERTHEFLDWRRHKPFDSLSAVTRVAYVLFFLERITCKIKKRLATRIKDSIPELKTDFEGSFISVEERGRTVMLLIRHHKKVYVTDNLRKSTKDLNLHLDEHNLLRCNGRIQSTNSRIH